MREYAKKPESQSRTLDSNPKASRQAPIDVILQRYKERNIQQYVEDEELIQGKFSDIVQREEFDEDELLQGKFDTAQCEEIDEDELLQGKFEASAVQREDISPSGGEGANLTGMPDNLKNGIESLSGYSMDDVRVHYNSAKPAQLQALACAQGMDIHIAPGQEQHLPHEAWHVVQQNQGRVQPTTQLQGVNVNDNEGLEKEADVMGGKAVQNNVVAQRTEKSKIKQTGIIQLVGDKIAVTKDNLEKGIPKEVIELQKEIYDKYVEYKKGKTDKRSQLDQKFKDETQNIDLKQDYLEKAIYMKVYQLHKKQFNDYFDKNTYDKLMQDRVDKKDQYLVDIDLLDNEKLALLKKAKEIALELINPIKEKLNTKKTGEKKLKIGELDSAIGMYARSYARHAIADPIVQGYEKGYISSAVDRKEIIKKWEECANPKGYYLYVIIDKSIGDVMLSHQQDDKKEYKIATMYFDDERFERVSEKDVILNQGNSNEETREVFRHRESGKEFVQDANNLFVRRYIKRALNKFDNPESGEGVDIKSDPRTKKSTGGAWKDIADGIPSLLKKQPQKVIEEIRNHQRAKEAQGGSPFISFTTTKHPIFGSTGSLFEGDRGIATVDLARISKKRIFDTHISPAMKLIHDIDNPQPEMPFKEGDEFYERNSAARDAMRTREIVIAGDIPLEAIIKVIASSIDYDRGSEGKFMSPEKATESFFEVLPNYIED